MTKQETKKTPEGSGVCKGCYNYTLFGKKCFFYWNYKKTCTHFRGGEFSLEEFKSVL